MKNKLRRDIFVIIFLLLVACIAVMARAGGVQSSRSWLAVHRRCW